MSTFEYLKAKAKAVEASDKAATESWVKANRAWLIFTAAVGLLCFLLGKLA